MKKILSKFAFVLSMAFIVYDAASSADPSLLPVDCRPEGQHQPSTYSIAGEHKTKLSLTFKGIWAEGFTDGLVTGSIIDYRKYDDTAWQTMSVEDKKIIKSFRVVYVEAQCIVLKPLSRGTKMKPGETLLCQKGEGIFIEYYSPECTAKDKIDRKAIFTLISTRDDDEEATKLAQAVAVPHQNGVLQGQDLPNGHQEPAVARATPENGTTARPTTNGATEGTGLIENNMPNTPKEKGCCGFPWGSS